MRKNMRGSGVKFGSVFLFVLLLGFALIGCKEKTEAPAPQAGPQIETKKGSFDSTKVNKDLKGGSIRAFKRTGGKMVFDGWAADLREGAPASSVIVVRPGKGQLPVEAKMGLKRLDVAKKFNAPELTNSGWSLTVPESLLGPGKHKLHFYAVLADGTLVPIGGREVEIK